MPGTRKILMWDQNSTDGVEEITYRTARTIFIAQSSVDGSQKISAKF